mgnify:CR=1 FL=1
MNENNNILLKKENEDYKNKIKELERKLQEKDTKINKLENKIKLIESYVLQNGEKFLSIRIKSTNQNIDLPIIIKNTEKFSKIEEILYKKNPNIEEEYYFLVNGIKPNKFQTLEENKIKDNDILTLVIKEN